MLQLFIKTAGATAIVWQPFAQKVTNLKTEIITIIMNPKNDQDAPGYFSGMEEQGPYRTIETLHTTLE